MKILRIIQDTAAEVNNRNQLMGKQRLINRCNLNLHQLIGLEQI